MLSLSCPREILRRSLLANMPNLDRLTLNRNHKCDYRYIQGLLCTTFRLSPIFVRLHQDHLHLHRHHAQLIIIVTCIPHPVPHQAS